MSASQQSLGAFSVVRVAGSLSALVLVAATAGGCATAPPVQSPDLTYAVPDQYVAGADRPRAGEPATPLLEVWWQQFDDPTLDALVGEALAENRELRIAYARLRAARAIRDDVSNDRLPTVTAGASADIGKAQQPGVTEQRVNAERYDLGLDMAWELDLFGRIQRRLESSEAQADAVEAVLPEQSAGNTDHILTVLLGLGAAYTHFDPPTPYRREAIPL